MDNNDIDDLAMDLVMTTKPFAIAEALVAAQELLDDSLRDNMDLRDQLAEYQRIYGSLDQGDYLRR